MRERQTKAFDVTPKLYTELCDVVERAWQHWPVDSHLDDPLKHTSDYARAAAIRILKILGLQLRRAPISGHHPSCRGDNCWCRIVQWLG
jgi:hypothetical protein